MRMSMLGWKAICAGIASVVLTFLPAHAQGFGEPQSLGDAARKQAEIHRQDPVEPKRYEETGTALPTAAPPASQFCKARNTRKTQVRESRILTRPLLAGSAQG